ncbi:ankyrin repeat domain-containing protein 39 [Cephus cinctus]|uniref:Ankyrin repeat domain-containing protein 39 n=1 Tax=Cephus cinctus TaxID=211228 RepID=A0AAJ7RNH1_CEPCN|nr:ankyrin repeat domain-containing protein 39 [Cephus cinctus]
MESHKHNSDECCCKSNTSSVQQSLPEMDFERGIWYAAQTGDYERLEKLLRKGVSPDIEDSAGYTALHYAARNGHAIVCRELLNRGANVNAQTRSGRATALHRAASQNLPDIIKLLLSFKADPNLVDADGNTALHRAVITNASCACEELLKSCNSGIVNKNNKTVYEIVKAKGQEDLIKLFQKTGMQ